MLNRNSHAAYPPPQTQFPLSAAKATSSHCVCGVSIGVKGGCDVCFFGALSFVAAPSPPLPVCFHRRRFGGTCIPEIGFTSLFLKSKSHQLCVSAVAFFFFFRKSGIVITPASSCNHNSRFQAVEHLFFAPAQVSACSAGR